MSMHQVITLTLLPAVYLYVIYGYVHQTRRILCNFTTEYAIQNFKYKGKIY